MKHLRVHVFAILLILAGLLLGAQPLLFNLLFQARSQIAPRQATGDIVVVAVDAVSIRHFGVWPWPRSLHAKLIDALASAGVTDIAFDIDFSSASSSAEDDSFERALQGHSSIILPAFRQVVGNRLQITEPLARFGNSAWIASVNVSSDTDGLVRKYPYGISDDGKEIPSMAVLLAGGKNPSIGEFYVDAGINRLTLPVVSYRDVINGDPSALASVRGHKVIVGGTALELGDRLPVAGGTSVAGPIFQALAAESLHQGRNLSASGTLQSWCVVIGAMTLLIAFWRGVTGWRRALIIAVIAIACEAIALYIQAVYPIIWNTAPVHIALFAYVVALTLDEMDVREMVSRISERRFKRITMSLPDALICTDSAGRVTALNLAAEKIFGVKPEEAVGQNVQRFVRSSETQPFAIQDYRSDTTEAEGVCVNGEVFPAEVRISRWDSAGQTNFGILLRDISERKREAEKIRLLAETDFLTGAANRYTLERTVRTSLSARNARFSLLLLDLDGFKQINDIHGHAFGDAVIKAFCERLKRLVRQRDLIARLGGDEFAIFIQDDDVGRVSEAMSEMLIAEFARQPATVLDRSVWLNATIGTARFPKDAGNFEALFANADLALYHAKENGRARWQKFDQRFRDDFDSKLEMETELTHASRNNEFELFYQPQTSLLTGKIVGAEALIRWRHPIRGLLTPATFLPVLNQSKISNEVGSWVLRTACRQAAAWARMGYSIRMGVNLAPSQLQGAGLQDEIRGALSDAQLPAELLEIEVTEDVVLSNQAHSDNVLRILRELGVKTAFDDFGTGFASLTHLKKFKLDVLKIDRSFVREVHQSPDDLAIVRSVIALGKSMGMSVIAEGVEETGVSELLSALGCDEVQGYLFGRPMPAEDFLDKLKAQSGPCAQVA